MSRNILSPFSVKHYKEKGDELSPDISSPLSVMNVTSRDYPDQPLKMGHFCQRKKLDYIGPIFGPFFKPLPIEVNLKY